MTCSIALAETDADIARCHPVMRQLRPHIEADRFLEQVRRQQHQGYRLAYLEDDGVIRALAGFRIVEMLAFGVHMYVDDLVTDGDARSRGYGRQLFDWLLAHARAQGCGRLELDSGVHRHAAHRFYLTRRMEISSHHFSLVL